MVGIILITHGTIGDEFIKVGSRIYGKTQQLFSVSILPEDSKETTLDKINGIISKADTGDGVLFLTDGFGGSPCNLSLSILKDNHAEVVTGLNLSMLLEVLCYQNRLGLKELSERAESGGKRGIIHASDMLRKKLNQGSGV